jgi:hypothetical protein
MCEKFTKCFLKITKECILTKLVTIRNNDRPWFSNEIRKEIRIRDRLRNNVLKLHRERDIKLCKKKQRNKVNNMNKIGEENFENNLDCILLENPSNPKTYYRIMKMLIKSNKGSNCIPPLSENRNDPDLVQTFLKKWWVESDFRSHLSSSPYTISSKFSSFIEFLRGGIQLLPLFDLISIFIIFQYCFGLDATKYEKKFA